MRTKVTQLSRHELYAVLTIIGFGSIVLGVTFLLGDMDITFRRMGITLGVMSSTINLAAMGVRYGSGWDISLNCQRIAN